MAARRGHGRAGAGGWLAGGALAVLLAVLAAGCAVSDSAAAWQPSVDLTRLRGTIRLDGSSTVFPISEAYAEEFQIAARGSVRVTVGISGTGGGFKKFCHDELDIADASRPISQHEIAECRAQGIAFVELPIAFDGLSVVVSPRNTFVDCLTVSELRTMWQSSAQGVITRWSQVRPGWPDRPFRLFGPGPDSGTFDYFTDAIMGREKDSRGDYTASEDDNVLVQGIANDPYALGYFGYAYYVENQSRLRVVPIDAERGGGCVAPSPETITSGRYQPLARPLFLYAKVAALERPEVREFLRFYLAPENSELIAQTGYVPLPAWAYEAAWQRLERREVGTVFLGRAIEGVTLDDLFGRAPTLPAEP
ncbi:MAG TPA: PstS family phosphate ABC transporter substrate-binding protein [Chloroflexota bacterium]|nr:PstS family phosphate ABC transporter substrate-binding protein [Chloroflexota bacterium]